MFRSLFHDHLQGSSFALSASTTLQPPASSFVFFGYVAVCHLFVCVRCIPVCVLSGRAKHDQTAHSNFMATARKYSLPWELIVPINETLVINP
jgi:hypothetical protein